MTLRLDRLDTNIPIIGESGKPSGQFQRLWQKTVESITTAFNNIEAAIAAAAAAQTAADAAQDDAIAAQADATQALANALAAQTTASAALTEAVADTLYVQQDVGAAWTAATGTEARTALVSYAGQTVSNPPTQAEMQALDNAVKAISQHLVAAINDLKGNGALT